MPARVGIETFVRASFVSETTSACIVTKLRGAEFRGENKEVVRGGSGNARSEIVVEKATETHTLGRVE
jgi:hypothetical protein